MKGSANPSLLGISMQLLIGPAIVQPAPERLVQSIKSVQVTNTDTGRDGFQITFAVGRTRQDVNDFDIFESVPAKTIHQSGNNG